jgi:hypothetical protein
MHVHCRVASATLPIVCAFVGVAFGTEAAHARQSVTEPWHPNQPRVVGPESASEGPKMLSVDPSDGGVFITGQSSIGDDAQTAITTWKFNRTTGAIEAGWPRTWTPLNGSPPSLPPPGYKAYGVCVLADGGGGCFVAGATTTDGEGLNMVFLRYDAGGNELVATTWNHVAQDGDDFPVDMALDGVGGLWIAGNSVGVGTGTDYVLLGLDTTSLQIQGAGAAVARYDAPLHKADTVAALAASPVNSSEQGGSFVNLSVTGTAFGAFSPSSKNDIVTLNYMWANSTLSLLAPSPIVYAGTGGASNEVATSIATATHPGVPSQLDVFVCGYSDKVPTRLKDYVILGYPKRLQDPVNTPAWFNQYPPANIPSVGDDIPVKVTAVAGPDSITRVIVTGTSWAGTEQNNVVTLAFTQSGSPEWQSILRQTDGQGIHYDERAVSMTAVFAGHVYVLGKRFQDKDGDGLLDFDFMTYGINVINAGALWTTTPTYNAPNGGPDGPASIDHSLDPATGDPLSPDVFIGGRSLGKLESAVKYTATRYK